MFIKQVINYEIDALEADLIVSDGKHDLMCYAQPFEDIAQSFYLSAFRPDNVFRAEKNVVI